MTDQAESPYQLAHYIIATPSKEKKFNTFDANPILQKLETHLLLYFTEMMLTGQIKEVIDGADHANGFVQVLAKKADEFCPSRTVSDLLLKHEIVMMVINQIGSIIKDSVTAELRAGGPGAMLLAQVLIKRFGIK